jgi:hypothetical protein
MSSRSWCMILTRQESCCPTVHVGPLEIKLVPQSTDCCARLLAAAPDPPLPVWCCTHVHTGAQKQLQTAHLPQHCGHQPHAVMCSKHSCRCHTGTHPTTAPMQVAMPLLRLTGTATTAPRTIQDPNPSASPVRVLCWGSCMPVRLRKGHLVV